MCAGAILSTIETKMRMTMEEDCFREYAAVCLRLLTENTAAMVYDGDGNSGAYMTADFARILDDLVHGSYVSPGEGAAGIREKFREEGVQ